MEPCLPVDHLHKIVTFVCLGLERWYIFPVEREGMSRFLLHSSNPDPPSQHYKLDLKSSQFMCPWLWTVPEPEAARF